MDSDILEAWLSGYMVIPLFFRSLELNCPSCIPPLAGTAQHSKIASEYSDVHAFRFGGFCSRANDIPFTFTFAFFYVHPRFECALLPDSTLFSSVCAFVRSALLNTAKRSGDTKIPRLK